MQAASFYGFHIKTVRSPIENRTFSIWKPYGFQLENVKVRLLKADYEPFNHVLVHIRANKFIGENGNIKTRKTFWRNSELFLIYIEFVCIFRGC